MKTQREILNELAASEIAQGTYDLGALPQPLSEDGVGSEPDLVMIQLETIEQERKTFTHPDPILDRIIETESARLREAAKTIGREWIGQFSRAHVLLMAEAYYLAKQGAKQNVQD